MIMSNRRKSSFFFREIQSVIVNEDNTDKDILTEKSLKEKAIRDHISEMEEEISDWNTTYRQIKSRRKELEKYKQDLNIIQWDQCKDDLSKEDMEFLNTSPDYKDLTFKLNDLVNKIEISKKQTSLIKVKVNHNVNVINCAIRHTKQQIGNYLLHTDESAFCNDYEIW